MPPMCMTVACLAAAGVAPIGEPAAADHAPLQDAPGRDRCNESDTPRRRIPRWLALELGLEQQS